jgi:hypothetical protein
MESMTLLGYGACTPDSELRASLPFPADDIDRNAIPALLRRRTSQATQMAFSAANRACAQAGRKPAELPAVFTSVGGEIQVTDLLCIELARPDGTISPTAFHNSVHNTAAGYWSIVHGCTRAISALAAGRDTFAMALLESWCQLDSQGGELLLICYDERWPAYLSAPMGAPPFASALVLGAGSVTGGIANIGRPQQGVVSIEIPASWRMLIEGMPTAAAIPLLSALTGRTEAREISLSAGGRWRAMLSIS